MLVAYFFSFCWFFAVVVLLLLLSYNIQERKLMRKHGASSWLGCERFRRTRKEEENRMNDVLPRCRRLFFLSFSLSLRSFFSSSSSCPFTSNERERICQFSFFPPLLHLLRWRRHKKNAEEERKPRCIFSSSLLVVCT